VENKVEKLLEDLKQLPFQVTYVVENEDVYVMASKSFKNYLTEGSWYKLHQVLVSANNVFVMTDAGYNLGFGEDYLKADQRFLTNSKETPIHVDVVSSELVDEHSESFEQDSCIDYEEEIENTLAEQVTPETSMQVISKENSEITKESIFSSLEDTSFQSVKNLFSDFCAQEGIADEKGGPRNFSLLRELDRHNVPEDVATCILLIKMVSLSSNISVADIVSTFESKVADAVTQCLAKDSATMVARVNYFQREASSLAELAYTFLLREQMDISKISKPNFKVIRELHKEWKLLTGI